VNHEASLRSPSGFKSLLRTKLSLATLLAAASNGAGGI